MIKIKDIEYLLDGFGFVSARDFMVSTFKLMYIDNTKLLVFLSAVLGMVVKLTGMEAPVMAAFVLLVCAEFWTGIKVARKVKGEKIKSRKLGRMFLKIGVYMFILGIIHTFATFIKIPEVMGFPLNPFVWLYYAVLVGIIFQFIVSYLENLGLLGYQATKTLAGTALRKLNEYFEVDGTKNNDDGDNNET